MWRFVFNRLPDASLWVGVVPSLLSVFLGGAAGLPAWHLPLAGASVALLLPGTVSELLLPALLRPSLLIEPRSGAPLAGLLLALAAVPLLLLLGLVAHLLLATTALLLRPCAGRCARVPLPR